MSYRLSKIYTRQGDGGYTNLGGKPLAKDDLLVEAVGSLDELNSHFGLILAFCQQDTITADLTQIQHDLFDMGGELHLPQHPVIQLEHITRLEQQIDAWNTELPSLEEFVLPRGGAAAATCHVARAVCRRTERCLVRLHRQIPLSNPHLLSYLNRLSDWLFVCARILARDNHETETLWKHERHKK